MSCWANVRFSGDSSWNHFMEPKLWKSLLWKVCQKWPHSVWQSQANAAAVGWFTFSRSWELLGLQAEEKHRMAHGTRDLNGSTCHVFVAVRSCSVHLWQIWVKHDMAGRCWTSLRMAIIALLSLDCRFFASTLASQSKSQKDLQIQRVLH